MVILFSGLLQLKILFSSRISELWTLNLFSARNSTVWALNVRIDCLNDLLAFNFVARCHMKATCIQNWTFKRRSDIFIFSETPEGYFLSVSHDIRAVFESCMSFLVLFMALLVTCHTVWRCWKLLVYWWNLPNTWQWTHEVKEYELTWSEWVWEFQMSDLWHEGKIYGFSPKSSAEYQTLFKLAAAEL